MNANGANPVDELPWDDVRTFLAISQGGSLGAAARALGVHHSTAFRRLSRLEARVGAQLFERRDGHYAPTAAGELFGRHAAQVQDALFTLQRAVLDSDLMPGGVLRFTTLDTLLPWVVPALDSLQARCPELSVELDASSQTRTLDRRDADMALRPSERPPPEALGRPIAKLAWALYAPCGRSGGRLPRLDYVGPLATREAPRMAVADDGPAAGRVRVRTVAAMAHAVAAGIGRGALPCYIGDSDPKLRRAGEAVVPQGSALWLLRHADLRDSARTRTLMDLLLPSLEAHADLFAGERPRRRR